MSSRIADLEHRLAAVEQRLAILEGRAPEPVSGEEPSVEVLPSDGVAATAASHIGRVLLIFGGAYLLRAITDYEFVPTAVGLLMGAVYALFWLVMAWRRGSIDTERVKAEFFGGTSVVLCLPLLYEATTHFELLTGTPAVVAATIYWLAAMSVAIRHRLTVLAWLSTFGGIAVSLALLAATHTVVPVAVFLLMLGVGTLWADYQRDWLGLCWLGGLGANLGVVTLLFLSRHWPISPSLVFGFAVAVLVAYLGSFTYETHVKGRIVKVFDAVQTVLAGGLVLASAAIAVSAGDLSMQTVGVMGVVLGLGGYGLAVARETRTLRYPNFFYYSSFGLVFLLVGIGLLMPPALGGISWAVLALAMAWFSSRTGWVSLSLQSTILLVAATAGSGLIMVGLEALAGDPANGWTTVGPSHGLVAAATVGCLFIPVAQKSDRWGGLAGLPQLIVLILSVWSVGGLFIALVAPLIASVNEPQPNLAVLAALRTAVLSVAAVILAVASNHRRWPEARWLVYPVLVLVGIKLFVEDFPHGEPTALFVAFGFVGSALLLAAPLLKRDTK